MRILPLLQYVERSARVIGTLFLINIVLSGAPLLAESQEEVEVVAQGIFQAVMSPYCPGRLLSDCPSSDADKLRNSIRSELVQGKSQEDVVKGLIDQFGSSIRSVPEAKGVGLLAWLIPIAFPAIGILLYLTFLKKDSR